MHILLPLSCYRKHCLSQKKKKKSMTNLRINSGFKIRCFQKKLVMTKIRNLEGGSSPGIQLMQLHILQVEYLPAR